MYLKKCACKYFSKQVILTCLHVLLKNRSHFKISIFRMLMCNQCKFNINLDCYTSEPSTESKLILSNTRVCRAI